ncbi:hypothetical protein CROQUDRAFT_660369 [Cronartium quercuum f. sp. fusiforme G11]|uniref:Uncharacterized protein n=1 Tax=Cronartium quercuum f. sp. fusiforme G11 TaxID=708437 RepID=A0A9P6NHG6_9BASI|nr:hypothetical protein CROQUDRAFT_660369 [Cronartium quercuum f. sp. fusiforme G11]
MSATQPLPDWLKPVTLTYQNSDHITTGLVELPIPYTGPSIPLSWPYTAIDGQGHLTQPPLPVPTQLVHFYDGSGPFTVLDGTIITDLATFPTPTPVLNLQPVQSTQVALPTHLSLKPALDTPILISTVYVPSPSQPTTNSFITTNNNQDSSHNSLSAILAGFITLLILFVLVVLSLLFFLIRRQRKRRQRSPIHLDSPRPYDFDSNLLPQHRHGNQTHRQQLDLLRDQHQWNLNEPLRSKEYVGEKSATKPAQPSTEARLGVWKRLRHELRSLILHFSLNPSPARSKHAPDHDVEAYGPSRVFRNPYHDPSVSTETFTRVSRWWAAVRTPASSFLRAPSSFRTLSGEESDLVESEKPFAFGKTSLVSRHVQSGSGLPVSCSPPDYGCRGARAEQDLGSRSSSRPSKSIKSSRSSRRKRLPDHPPLLEATSEDDEDDRADSPLEHLPHLSLSPFRSTSTPVPLQPALNTSPLLSTGSKRVRRKKSTLPNRTPGSSPYSISYNSSVATPIQHSPGRILVLKRRSDIATKAPPPLPFPSPSSLLTPGHSSSRGADTGQGNESSPTLRFPLPPRPTSGAEFVEVTDFRSPIVNQSVSTTTEDEEIVYRNINKSGPRRSSISNLGGVSELGVFEDRDGSYVSEDLFYVRPKLARFKDGHLIEAGHEEVGAGSATVATGTVIEAQQDEGQHEFPSTNNRSTNSSDSATNPESSTISHVLSLIRRSVSLPVSTNRVGELSKSGISPLDRLAGEESDSEPEDERSRLLNRPRSSRYSRATLGQRLEVNSLRGSLANLSGSGGTNKSNKSKKVDDDHNSVIQTMKKRGQEEEEEEAGKNQGTSLSKFE